jgi:hypothetical protein
MTGRSQGAVWCRESEIRNRGCRLVGANFKFKRILESESSEVTDWAKQRRAGRSRARPPVKFQHRWAAQWAQN